jgi:hypothetical protein
MTLGNARSVLKTIADVTSADRLRIYIDTSVLGASIFGIRDVIQWARP